MTVAVITLAYPNDIRIFKEIETLKKEYTIHIFLSDTRKTTPKKERYNTVVVHRFSHQAFDFKLIQYPFSLFRYIRIVKAAAHIFPDVCHVHDFPRLFAGILVKMLTGCNLVYDAHEDFASMVYQENPVLMTVIRKIELLLVHLFVDRVITVNHSLKAYFLKSHTRTHVLMNVPMLNIQSHGDPVPSADFVVGYIGHIIQGRGYTTLIPVCNYLVEWEIPFKILLVGRGPFKERIEELISENGLEEYFVLTGEVEHDRIPSFLQQIDVGLVLFKPVRYNNIIATPNKLFEYMAWGIPLVVSDLPEMRKIVTETNSGIVADPTDARQIAEHIKYLYENPEIADEMGKNGRKAFETRYNWDTESKELVTLYQELSG
jgi:glycosyltransferase involved in cell wall biosynthesis